MDMIFSNTALFNFNVRMIILNLKHMLFYKSFQLSLQDSLPVLWYPDNVILVVIRSMGTVSYLHALILSPPNNISSLRLERFHPRAYARGPQRFI
jgi:hypothetical protein